MEDGTFRDFETREEADKVRWSMLSPLHQHPNGLYASHELPPGSVYEVTDWGYAAGLDGRAFNVVCPDGWHWNPDSRASNCTLKEDRVHRCWCRHGNPDIPGGLHVDKVGNTCAAGAGSIQTDRWHGFLHNGYLVEGDHQIPRGAIPVGLNFDVGPQVVAPPRPPDTRDGKRIGGWGS